jgi:hypothetical protein
VLRRARQRVDEQHQAAGDRGGAGRVEVPVVEVCLALAQQERRESENSDACRNIDEEDPRPAERARERPAEQHAGGTAAPGCGAPDAEREISLASLAEGCGEDRECGGREQRGAEPLQRTESDQRSFRPREAVEQRAGRKQDHSCDEQSPAPKEVGEPAAEQEDAAEEDRVGGDHPLEALLAEVEVGLDRGKRNVHDGDIENDHELGRDDHGERKPALSVVEGTHKDLQSYIASTMNAINGGPRYAIPND